MPSALPRSALPNGSARTAARESGLIRQGVEALVYLALAVVLFRGFAVEGYMISTGSMAPCLLGYHRQVVCPSCSFAFSRGTHFDEEDTILAGSSRITDQAGDKVAPATICPNCGLTAIDASAVPRNEGDQLLVHKHLYQLRPPRRWEVVVFRHPEDPNQAYVKRVVGLPEETIDVMDGDVYANGVLQRKPLETQRSMRIPVFDHDHEPSDPDWRPRWRADDEGRWSAHGEGFVHRRTATSAAKPSDVDWLTYHHWVRDGETQNHEGPIVDQYGYNHPAAGDGPLGVHDLMLEAVVQRVQGDGKWQVRMSDGWHCFELVFDVAEREVSLSIDDADEPVRKTEFPDTAFSGMTAVEMSLFDRQVLVAVDGVQLFEPLRYADESLPRRMPSHPVQIGAAGLDVQVSHLRLYRDVHYTPKHAVGRDSGSWTLQPDEFFMLGDNSPVSLDSRAWDSPAIPRNLLIGKPFLVHLPSQQGKVEVAGSVHYIRIPDFSRVRYIR